MPIRHTDIRSISLFRKIQERDTPLLLQYFVEHDLPPDAYLTESRKLHDTLYVLISGEIQIQSHLHPPITLKAGDFFGANQVLNPQLSTYSAQTISRCRILSLSNIDLRNMIDQAPSIAADIVLQIAECSIPIPPPNPAAFEEDLANPALHYFENSPGINRSRV